MKAYVKGIALFKSEQEKRFLPLNEGLNIITGESQTGKSAVYDIIDWCLGADKCSIPKGVITKFSKIYAIIFCVNKSAYLIARKNEKEGKFMFFKEINSLLSINDLKYSEIQDSEFLPKKSVVQEIDRILNLTVKNNGEIELNFNIDLSKAGIRSAISYIFQHQGVIASKKDLFYYSPIKSHFPVLAGWVDQNYYAIENEYSRLRDKIKAEEKNIKNIKNENKYLENELRAKLRIYYGLLDKDADTDISIDEIADLVASFPPKPKYVDSNKLSFRKNQIEVELRKIRSEKALINNNIEKLHFVKNEGNSFKKWLINLTNKQDNKYESNICPICENPSFPLKEAAIKINESKIMIEKEIKSIESTTIKFDDILKPLQEDLAQKVERIKLLQTELSSIEEIIDNIINEKPIEDQIYEAQQNVAIQLKFVNTKWKKIDYASLEISEKRLSKITEEIETKKIIIKNNQNMFSLQMKNFMAIVADKLSFEHRPANLHFSVDNFDLFHINEIDNEIYYLSQLGSASNYLACHLGLFLGFLYYFSSQENSKVPSILFLDQPSQVYFSSGDVNNDADMQQVKNIYDTLLYTINEIKNNFSFVPQIIVSDHIGHLGEDSDYLKELFVANWRNGSGLV